MGLNAPRVFSGVQDLRKAFDRARARRAAGHRRGLHLLRQFEPLLQRAKLDVGCGDFRLQDDKYVVVVLDLRIQEGIFGFDRAAADVTERNRRRSAERRTNFDGCWMFDV